MEKKKKLKFENSGQTFAFFEATAEEPLQAEWIKKTSSINRKESKSKKWDSNHKKEIGKKAKNKYENFGWIKRNLKNHRPLIFLPQNHAPMLTKKK